MTLFRISIAIFMMIAGKCFSSSDTTQVTSPLQCLSIGLINAYQIVGHVIPFDLCIYEPSCSNFALEAISQYGTLRGVQMTANRIMRCNPSRRFEKDSRYIPVGGKLFDPPEDYIIHNRTFSAGFLLPGFFQFRKGEVFDGVLAVGFTGVPVYALVRSDFKFNAANIVFCLVGAIFYSGHLNYCYTYPI